MSRATFISMKSDCIQVTEQFFKISIHVRESQLILQTQQLLKQHQKIKKIRNTLLLIEFFYFLTIQLSQIYSDSLQPLSLLKNPVTLYLKLKNLFSLRYKILMNKIVFVFISLLVVAFSRTYPLHKQCDTKWKNDIVGGGSKTMCQVGCLVTSVSMALEGTGRKYNPKDLNKWLKGHKGFSGNLFVWSSVNSLGLKFDKKVKKQSVKAELDKGRVVILNVRKGGHWVLAYGYTGDDIKVNDPGYSKLTYPLSQVVTAGVFIP